MLNYYKQMVDPQHLARMMYVVHGTGHSNLQHNGFTHQKEICGYTQQNMAASTGFNHEKVEVLATMCFFAGI